MARQSLSNELEVLVRWAPVLPELLPLPIYSGNPLGPIEPEWMGIVRTVRAVPGRRRPMSGYNLMFVAKNGGLLEWLQFDTLRIALDQAPEVVGAQAIRWRRVQLPVDTGRPLHPPKRGRQRTAKALTSRRTSG